MLALVKGIIPGCILNGIVSGVIGSTGSRGGILDIQRYIIEGYHVYWSWSLMLVAIGLCAALFLMMD